MIVQVSNDEGQAKVFFLSFMFSVVFTVDDCDRFCILNASKTEACVKIFLRGSNDF